MMNTKGRKSVYLKIQAIFCSKIGITRSAIHHNFISTKHYLKRIFVENAHVFLYKINFF